MSNIQMPPPDKSKLSYHLKDFSFSHEASGLDLQGKTIQELDHVPSNFRELELLILDNNLLVDLQGIQQFQGLKQLSLINNQIVDILNVYHLRSLSLLEELDLRGNAIATRPGYRETILLFLKNLKLLDGKTIKAADRLKIPQQLSIQYTLLDRLVKNYSEILRLQSAIQKLEMFKELFNLNKNFLMTYVFFDLDKFRRLFNYLELIQEKTRNQFRGDLLTDVRTIELEFLHKQDMQAAAQELLSRQSKNIAELTHRIKQKAQTLASLYSEHYTKFDMYDQTQEELLFPSILFPKSPFRKSFRRSASPNKLGYNPAAAPETTVNNYFNFKNNPFDSVNQSTISLKSPVDAGYNKKPYLSSKPVHKHAVNDRLYSPRKDGSPLKGGYFTSDYDPYATNRSQQAKGISGYQKDLLETYQKQTSKIEEQLDYKRPKSPDDLIQYISPTAQSMSPTRNQNPYALSPKSAKYQMDRSGEGFNTDARPNQETIQILEEVVTRKDWDSKEEQRSQLSKNLEQKLQELSTVNNINKDLKIKLKSLHEQNEIHLRLAKEEIEKANEDMMIAEQSRKQLEVEIARLKRNISEYSTANAELEKHKNLLQEEREYLKKYENELVALQILENRAFEAYRQYEKKLQAKFFRLLAVATDYSQRIKQIALKKQLREKKELLTTAFSMIKRNRIIQKIVKYKISRVVFTLNQKYFSEWKSFTKQRKIETCLALKREKEHLGKLFTGWLQHFEKRKLRNAVKEKILAYYVERLIEKGFKGLKRNFDLYGLGSKAERHLNNTAVAKNKDWIKRSTFLKWTKWTREVSIPKKLAINAAEDQYRMNLQRLGLNLLKINYILFKDRYKKAEMLRLRRDMRTIETVFSSWKFDYRKIERLKRQRKELADRCLQRKKYNIWRDRFNTARRLNYLTINAQRVYESNCKKKCFGVFMEIREKGKAASKLEEAFVRKNDALLIETLYNAWRDLFLRTLTNRKIARLESIEIQGTALKKWMAYTNKCREKKNKSIQADRLYSKTWQKNVCLVFQVLKRNLLQGKRRKENTRRIVEKKKKRTYKKVFITLKEFRMKELKKRYAKLAETHEQIKRENLENEDNITTLDRERLDLSERVDEVSEITQSLKEENERKKREIERFEEIIKDKEKRHNKLEEELRKRRDKLDEAENTSKDITLQLAENVRNNERTLELMREEKEGYNNAIVQLLADMKEKDRTLSDIEQENISIRNKRERYMKDSSQAIDDLKKEIRLVKEGTDTKEQELRRAMELVQVLERRNQELRSQLHGTVIDLERSTLDFRSRIKNLEQKNLELLNETDKLKFENERRGKEIIELGGTAKKYEYEIEYMKSGPNYRKAPRTKGSPLKPVRLGKDDVTFRDAKIAQSFALNQSKDLRLSNTSGIRPSEEVGDLQEFLSEKRKILDQLDEKQDQIRKNPELKEIRSDELMEDKKMIPDQSVEEASKSQPAPPEEDNRKVNQSKRKIEEIKRKLEDLKSNKKDIEEGSKP